MRANLFTTFIAIGLSALIAFGFFSFNNNNLRLLLGIGSLATLGLTLFYLIGARFTDYRTNVNVRSASTIFFVVFFASHLLFSFLTFSTGVYIVVHGILLLLYLLVIYWLIKPSSAL